MFSKPLSIILVYLLSITNFLIITIPFLVVLSPLLLLSSESFVTASTGFMIFSVFVISSLMLSYLILDLLFGISISGMTKGHKQPKQLAKQFPILNKIEEDYNDLQKQFRIPNTRLLIARSSVVNAYAIGSFRKNVVVLTMGLIAQYKKESEGSKEFYQSIKGIVAHELSHLANRDFLPGLLVFANEKAVNFASRLVRLLFMFFARLLMVIPVFGSVFSSLIISLYQVIDKIISSFYRFVFIPVYNFIKLHVSRSTEYRCDRQAAEACGGAEMAVALSGLGPSGFITIFSTHPATRSRMKYVANRKMIKGRIRISILNRLSNLFAVFFLVYILNFTFQYIEKLEYFHSKYYTQIYYEHTQSISSKFDSIKKMLKF